MTRHVLLALLGILYISTASAQQPPSVDDAIVHESNVGPASQVSTSELRRLLATGAAALLDARPPEEFAMSHIPGALNVSQKPGTPMSLYVSDVAEVQRLVPDTSRTLVVYCNGPFCGKSRRLAEQLVASGYRDVRRYQLGMPGWRATGGVAEIDASAVVASRSSTGRRPSWMRGSQRASRRCRPWYGSRRTTSRAPRTTDGCR